MKPPPSITLINAVDPGSAGAGYCIWHAPERRPLYVGTQLHACQVSVLICESGFVGRMGKREMWGLGRDAGWRMCEAHSLAEHGTFTIRPDGKQGWRAALPSVSGTFQGYDGYPGDVIVKRLRARYLHVFPGLFDWAGMTEHEVEAVGIAEAAAAILARPKAKDRKALVRVKVKR